MNIDKICEVLNNGGLVITPTDTVYGIMGDALNECVIKKIFEVKKRPLSKPVILLMNSMEMVEKYISEMTTKEKRICEKFWPGLVTIILRKNDKVSNLITASKDTVGIRIPDNDDLLRIISKLGRPVVSTSANITGTEVITSIKLLEKDLASNIDYIEDAGDVGECSSTIVRIDDDKINVLREGKLSAEVKNYFTSL